MNEYFSDLRRIHERLLDVKARGYRLAQLGAIAEDLGRLLSTLELLDDPAEVAALRDGLEDIHAGRVMELDPEA